MKLLAVGLQSSLLDSGVLSASVLTDLQSLVFLDVQRPSCILI
jgi:hypothetical protein